MPSEWPSSTYTADVHQQRAYRHRFSFREEGLFGLSKGWAPTLIGYSFQGLGKFGFYEIFKLFYAGLLGDQNAYSYRTVLYLVSSASAEIFADIALAPWEATKVRIQTQDNWASTLRRGLPKLYGNERKNGFGLLLTLLFFLAEEGMWGYVDKTMFFPLTNLSDFLLASTKVWYRCGYGKFRTRWWNSPCLNARSKRSTNMWYLSHVINIVKVNNWRWHSSLVISRVCSVRSSAIQLTQLFRN